MAEWSGYDMKNYISSRQAKWTLSFKMMILTAVLLTAVLGIVGVFFYQLLGDSLEQQMGERALSVSKSTAEIPELRERMAGAEPGMDVQDLIEPIRLASEAEFIVVGDLQERRYSHPDPDLLGQRMVGEDNDRALEEGLAYVSRAEGSLGPSIRGKTPLRDPDGEIIGVVSVGFLVEDVQSVVQAYRSELFSAIAIVFAIGLAGALVIARYIKRALFGMEPEEISYLLLQKETILQSAHEGIIAVNKTGGLTLINKAAQRMLHIEGEDLSGYIGRPVQDVLANSRLPEVLESGESQYDEEMTFGEYIVVANRVPLYENKQLVGAVSTFRNKTEIERLTKELSRVKEYAEGLRAQTHEFSNKLYTISGLLQLNETEEAVQYIRQETKTQKSWIRQLIEKISDPMLSALLLGKMNQALELGIHIDIDETSSIRRSLSSRQRQALITALGNTIDNAIDAVRTLSEEERTIQLFFTDMGGDILFEVENGGPGIPEALQHKIFEQGFSTKQGGHRGFGLALCKRALEDIGGTLSLESDEESGTCFILTIPSEKEETR
ncbi:ATP-binding protein [Alkalicoccus halolimnae]|uniref:histidine kinase n=1 Tax=Alkalicoccus halolimnae TaxID=1667239 RepID=A0AAJ8LXM2_9BACI|nr:sensor histidine kinase [Alkalicoccus halolimnae]